MHVSALEYNGFIIIFSNTCALISFISQNVCRGRLFQLSLNKHYLVIQL